MSDDEYDYDADEMQDDDDFDDYDDDDGVGDDYVQFEDPRREDVIQVLEEDQLLRQQNEIVTTVSELLNVTPSAACSILRYFRWNYDELSQKYFEDPEKLRKTLGLDLGTKKPFEFGNRKEVRICQICFDEMSGTNALALNCMHWYCRECWTHYLCGKVDEGPSCVQTHCPAPKCWQAVDEMVFQELLPEEHFARYRKFILRSFVEDNPYIRWCPGPNCNKAILCKDVKKLFVQCLCGYKFCFICGEEAHAPVKCDLLRLWRVKEKGEGDNSKWLFANTKSCPQCQSPIQKNDGCNHMTCSKCRWEFCWICLGEWAKHGTSWYKCNYFDPKQSAEEEVEKGKVRKELERYVFYYTRYHEHLKSKEFNQSDLQKAEEKVALIQKSCGGVNADYIIKAVEQLIENRVMLQYTYIYAYYLSTEDKGKDLFEYLQQKLEGTTEDFNTLLKKILDEPNPDTIIHDPQFAREKVADITALARDQLHKLLKGVFDEEEEAMACEPPVQPITKQRSDPKSKSRSKGLRSNKSQDPVLSEGTAKIPNFDEKLSELSSMGFNHESCVEALLASEGSLDTAIQILLAS